MRKIILDENERKAIKGIEVDNEAKVENTKKSNEDKMFDYIEKIMSGKTYGIGIHSITKGDREKKLNSILENGIELKENDGILSTVSSFGTSVEYKTRQSIVNYSWGKEEQKLNVIILVPYIISNSEGKKLYLGFPLMDTGCVGNNHTTTCVLDAACKSKNGKGRIPKEFILGHYTQSEGKINFIANSNYYEFLPTEEKDKIFSEMDSKITGKARTISDAVLAEDIETLKKMSQSELEIIQEKEKQLTKSNILERGFGNMQLARNLAETSVQLNREDLATQALDYLETERTKENTEKQNIGKSTRKSYIIKVLLESYRRTEEVNLSGVKHAKGRLEEGLENEQQKSYEGEEK